MSIKIQVGGKESGIIVARDLAGDMVGGTVVHDLAVNSIIVVLDAELDGVIEALQQIKLHVESRK